MKSLTLFTTKGDTSLKHFSSERILRDWKVTHYFYEELSEEQVATLPLGNFVYLRDPFNVPFDDLSIQTLLQALLKRREASVSFIDNLTCVDDIYFEDKWFQYEIFKTFMPLTFLATADQLPPDTSRIYKKRISSRARDIYFTKPTENLEEYISQERLAIKEEYRVLEVSKQILPTMLVRSSKNEITPVKILAHTPVTPEILTFIQSFQERHRFDLVGYDIVKTTDNTLFLIEVNRSPQITAFIKNTATHPFEILLEKFRVL